MVAKIICIILTLLGGIWEYPEESNKRLHETLTQQVAINLALKNNPDLRVAKLRLERNRTKIDQARTFPSTSIDFDFDQQEKIFFSDETYFGFSQEIEFPTRSGLRVRIAENEFNVTQTGFDLLKRETVLTVKEVYQRLALTGELKTIADENVSISERLFQMTREKYNVGSVSKLDVLRASIEAANAQESLSRIRKEESSTRIQLNYLIGRTRKTAIATTPLLQGKTPEPSLAELIALAKSHRIEPKSIDAQHASSLFQQSLARTGYYPDFSVGVSRHYIHGETDSWDVTFSVNLPLFGRSAIAAQVAEAHAEERALLMFAEATNSRIAREVREAYQELQQLKESVGRFQDVILVQAQEAFDIARASYVEGEIGNLELLESQRTLQEVKKSYAETIYQYNLALINLEQATGADMNWEETTVPE